VKRASRDIRARVARDDDSTVGKLGMPEHPVVAPRPREFPALVAKALKHIADLHL
jgi:hypothetical protein